MRLSLLFPVKPFHLNQGFGSDSEYYAKFHDQFGKPYKGHDGSDLMAAHGEPVFAPIDGFASYSTDAHGGEGVTIMTEALDYAGGTCYFQILHWHLIGDTDPKYPQPFSAKQVKAGDLIGYADNTGAPYESSGDHLHFGLKPVDKNGKLVFPANGFNGAVDATPYWANIYAQEIPAVAAASAVVASLPPIVREIDSLPASQQPYFKQVLLNILDSLRKLIT